MRKWICLLFMVVFTRSVMATVPPMTGGKLPRLVKEHTERMQQEYPDGRLAKMVQKWARQKILLQKMPGIQSVSTNTLQYQFPVLVGKYLDAGTVKEDAPQELQKELFDGPWPTITMREFYLENSYNQFDLGGTLYGWIQASKPESLYTGPPGTYGMDGYAADFVRELLGSVDSVVDFAQYDNDADGFVETLFVVHSGPGQEYYGENPGYNHIWSHSSKLSYYGDHTYFLTNDFNTNSIRVKVNHYIIQPAVNYNGSLISIGVFCHEFGHALGLPDLYDTDYSSEGIGNWGIMSGGNWNRPESPSHFCSWSKEILGWLSPIVIKEDTDLLTVTPVEENPVVYKLWKEGNPEPYTSLYGKVLDVGKEYFLLENRQRIGSDKYLHEPGLLIWHVDNSVMDNTDEFHKLVDLEEADGLNHLDLKENRGDSGDPFPGFTGNMLFNSTSNPASYDYNDGDSKVGVSIIGQNLNDIVVNLKVGTNRYEFTQTIFEDANENGIFEMGEQISLWLEIQNNTGSTAENVNLQVSSSSMDLSFPNPTVSFGNIFSGGSANNQSDPFLIDISAEALENTILLEVRLLVNGEYIKSKQIDLVIGIPELLVLDADLSKGSLFHFKSWLDKNGRAYEMIGVQDQNWQNVHFSQRDLIAVIGGDNPGALSDSVLQDSLQNWMTENKSLLIIAPQVASELDTFDFSRNFLHIRYSGSTINDLLKGNTGDPIDIGGGSIFLEPEERQMVAPENGGAISISFDGTNYGGLIRCEDEHQNKIIFSSIDLRLVKDDSPVSSEMIMLAIFNWFGMVVDIADSSPVLPEDFLLLQNYPNPFNLSTSIRFYISTRNIRTELMIFNSLGEKIRRFKLLNITPGWNQIEWDGKDDKGNIVSSGIYYYMLQTDNGKISRKMVLLK
jgi:M6 family metalloprotease-like protein